VGVNLNYTNLGPYFSLVKQRPNFSHSPEYIGTEGFFRQKTKASGMLKFYGYYNHGQVGFRTPAPDGGNPFGFNVKNNNVYTNLSWAGLLQEKWKLNLGTSYSNDWNDINSSYNVGFLNADTFRVRSSLGQIRAMATHFFGRLTSLRFGGEYQFSTDGYENRRFGNRSIEDNYSAAFVESDLYVTTKLVARLGLRAENSTLLGQAKLAPRVSLAYKLGKGDQFSFAWGYFYQKGDSLLRWQNQFDAVPGFQRAEHYILNYQYILNNRSFRVEGYYKKYKDLITTREHLLRNDGAGYAQGLELFYRDKETFKGMDFWLSYSYLDTKRRFQWYPVEAQPTYAANHVATLVAKKYLAKIRTSVGMTYNYSTGRPYYNPNRPLSEFLVDRTPAYNSLSINANYLTTIRKAFTVVVLGVNNVLGQEQIFGYRYASDGSNPTAIRPAASRFVFIGAFLSWGTDRRQEVLDNQN
ncbi:MAG: TonB-dependent receptor, partial [Saprospiraceae bacterium]